MTPPLNLSDIEEIAVAVMAAVRQTIPSAGSNVDGLAVFMARVDSELGQGRRANDRSSNREPEMV